MTPRADNRLAADVPMTAVRCDCCAAQVPVRKSNIYSWDAASLVGSLDSSFPAGCNGEPAGPYTYPFTLSRM